MAETEIKVLFLDIDGVMNSEKTWALYGDSYVLQEKPEDYLDPCAVRFMKLLIENGVQIVLSSSWREQDHSETQKRFTIPLSDRTDRILSQRGEEIQEWLDRHPEVTNYVIVDDCPDMLESQLPHFVQTSGIEGLTFKDMKQICDILHLSIYDLRKNQ